MNIQALDAFDNADRMYEQYTKLAALSELSMLGDAVTTCQEIVASVSPVMRESYGNALLG